MNPANMLDIQSFLAHVEQSIPSRFEMLAAAQPSHLAIGCGQWKPTYGELNTAANQMAHALLSLGFQKGNRVGLLLQHDGPLFAAVLAVLKAAGIVVSLNPTDPPYRQQQIIADSQPAFIITDQFNASLAHQIAPAHCNVLPIEESFGGGISHNPGVAADPSEVAFLLYTSGSTGHPKGVMQTHRNILHNILRLAGGMGLQPNDRVALLTAISGGQGIAVLWCALATGATLYPFPAAVKGVTGLAAWIREHQVTALSTSASLFRHFARTLDDAQQFPSVRIIRIGSESATSEDFTAFQKHFCNGAILLHTLSSTETGNMTQMRLTTKDAASEGFLPVGSPVNGVEILLLNDQDQPVAENKIGQVVVRGRYLSPGYWNNEVLTKERFSTDGAGLRRFKTGDRGRRSSDGQLWFAGRGDAQVKIRGYRIELAEIEDALNRLPDVHDSIVCAHTRSDGTAELVAHLIPSAKGTCDLIALRSALTHQLPSHMFPSHFILTEQFPLNTHGKIDREKLRLSPLPINDPSTHDLESENASMTTTEQLLLKLWSNVLPQAVMTRQTNFFHVGGDSLRAAIITARLHGLFQIEINLKAFADHPTMTEFAAFIDELLARQEDKAEVSPPIIRVSRDTPAPLSFTQERFWEHAHTHKNSINFNMASSIRIRGPLDIKLLHEAMSALIRRHEMLRTTFHDIEGRGVQTVHPPQPAELPLLDFSAAADPEAQATRLLRREARKSFDLGTLPLLRFILIRTRLNEHLLLRIGHHIIFDAWSWTVYFRELEQLYEAAQRGESLPLTQSDSLQYVDYAVWQRKTMSPGTPDFTREVEWWSKSLAGLPAPAKLPFARRWKNYFARPSDGFFWWGVETAVSQRLEQLARSQMTTGYVVRLAAFAALLAAESKQQNIILGTFLTNRHRAELLNMFGLFTNLGTLPLVFQSSQTFSAWLAAVRKTVGETQAHCQIPHDMLCNELRRRNITPPEAHAIFRMSDHTAPQHFGGLELEWIDRRMETMPWRFTLAFDQFNEESRCYAAFDARHYDPLRVQAFIKRLKRLLDGISQTPEAPLPDILATYAII